MTDLTLASVELRWVQWSVIFKCSLVLRFGLALYLRFDTQPTDAVAVSLNAMVPGVSTQILLWKRKAA